MLDGRPVRFGYDPLEFRDFSWRGYALMSAIQVGEQHGDDSVRIRFCFRCRKSKLNCASNSSISV